MARDTPRRRRARRPGRTRRRLQRILREGTSRRALFASVPLAAALLALGGVARLLWTPPGADGLAALDPPKHR